MKTTLRQMPLLAPSISYALGILIGFYIPIASKLLLFLLCSAAFLIILSWQSHFIRSAILILLFLFLGIGNHYLFTSSNHCSSCEILLNKRINLNAKLHSEAEVNASLGSMQFVIISKQLGNIRLQSNFKGPLTETLLIGDHLRLIGKLKSIHPPSSPRQFDYKQYLQHKGIYYAFEIEEIIKLNASTFSLRRVAEQVKIVCKQIIKDNIKNEPTRQICLAMVLGEKKSMDDELIKSFRDTGTSHYMAVSGLHVDLVALLLLFSFRSISCQWFGFKLLKYLCYISFIWSYALLVGLSPSVLRAATMFTFYSYGRIFMLPSNTWNTLALTAIILLMYSPSFLFDVGFQLSFIAVISIVMYSPLLIRQLKIRGKFLKKCFNAIKVTLAVQILIFPLNLYYFHQFPLNFIIANSFFWLFALIIIYGSIFLILISFVSKAIATTTGLILGYITDLLHHILGLIQHIDSFILKDVWLTKTELIVMYVSIGCLTWIILQTSKISITCLLFSITLLLELYIIRLDEYKNVATIYVYRSYPTYTVDFIYQDTCYTYSSMESQINSAIANNRSYHSIRHLYEFDGFGCMEEDYFWNFKTAVGFFGLNVLVDASESISNYCAYDIIISNAISDTKKCRNSSLFINTAYVNEVADTNIYHLATQGTFTKEIKLK